MELRHHLQEQEGVPAGTAANVQANATLISYEQISDMLDRFAIGYTDVVILVGYGRKVLLHALHAYTS
jgi:hypothetical protein